MLYYLAIVPPLAVLFAAWPWLGWLAAFAALGIFLGVGYGVASVQNYTAFVVFEGPTSTSK
jgi:hypothetical protein